MWVLIALAGLALVVSLIVLGINNARDGAGQQPAPSTQGSTSPTQTRAARPPSSGRRTSTRNRRRQRRRAAGTGRQRVRRRPCHDLEDHVVQEPTQPGRPEARRGSHPRPRRAQHGHRGGRDLAGGATSVELRVPSGAEPSARTEKDWTVVGADDSATGTARIALDKPTETRWLMVYLTSLPKVGDRYVGEIAEITLG
ncbi:hypothetical protein G7085_10270 [Tessaracoccus sp. HDW20]|uniref:hypothetical protein n=1 Tax=Tessaracoccus coleopterorum TaxID=2714950 RepID=UPI0018D4CFEB|nr:hypothetical protein [Tessaracoccus coleopterorum]NHB84858.1 hypothetical protein [Tessaracoccus coleopterorum]